MTLRRSPLLSSIDFFELIQAEAPANSSSRYGTDLVSVNLTVLASGASTLSTTETWLLSELIEPSGGFFQRVTVATTSADEKGDPSWNLTPWRSLKVKVLPSADFSHDSARSPTIVLR